MIASWRCCVYDGASGGRSRTPSDMGKKERHAMPERMSDEKKSPPQIRLEVYEELLGWLRQQQSPKRWAFLDRPFVLTILGGVAAGLLTTWWQASEKRREIEVTYQRAIMSEQLSLVKELDATYQNTGEIVNGWFARVIWIAEEANRPKSPGTEKNIAKWKDQTQKLEERFSTAPPLGSLLLRIAVLYRCPSVKNTASQMLQSWDAYVNTFQIFNRDWNEKQQLSKSQIDTAESARRKMLSDLEKFNEHLTRRMAGEISAARDNIASCPP
jgi:hypothetical protein